MNMGNVSNTTKTRTQNLFRLKRKPIPLDHTDGCLRLPIVENSSEI